MIEAIGDLIEATTDILVATAASPLVYLVVLLVAALDGFFPPVPSETIVVAVIAVGATTGAPVAAGIILAAAIGAILGDNLAYLLGRLVGTTRFRWMRRPSAMRILEWAATGLRNRPASLILIGRYIPIGRIAVNMMAGATGLRHRRFLVLTIVAGFSWAAYAAVIGLFAAAWIRDSPLLAAVVAVVIAMVLGLVIDRIASRISHRRSAANV